MSKNMIRFGQVKGLEDRFVAEAAQRAEDVAALQDDLSGLADVTGADRAAIRSELAVETAARVAAVQAEETARIAADAATQQALGNMADEIFGAIGDKDAADIAARLVLTNDLAAEVATRTSEVSRLDGRVDSVLSNVTPESLDSLTEIVAAFESADGNLQTSIGDLAAAASTDRGLIRDEFTAADGQVMGVLMTKDQQINSRVNGMTELEESLFSWTAYEGGFKSTDISIEENMATVIFSLSVNGLRVEQGADKDYVIVPGSDEGHFCVKLSGEYDEEIADNSSCMLRRLLVPFPQQGGGGN